MIDGAGEEDGAVPELREPEGGKGEEVAVVAYGGVEGEEEFYGGGDVGGRGEEEGEGEGGGGGVGKVSSDIGAGDGDAAVREGVEAAGERGEG